MNRVRGKSLKLPQVLSIVVAVFKARADLVAERIAAQQSAASGGPGQRPTHRLPTMRLRAEAEPELSAQEPSAHLLRWER